VLASAGNVDHVYSATGPKTISVSLVDEDGTFLNPTTVAVQVNPALEVARVGNAPARLTTANPNAWVDAWTHSAITLTHRADADNTAEPWTPVALNNGNTTVLIGGDLSLGDLGVSGQTSPTNTVRQEIDGSEGLRFDLSRPATSATINLSSLVRNESGLGYAEAGRLQAFDDAGNLVAEQVFHADSAASTKAVTISAAGGFESLVITAGAYQAGQFVDGAYAALDGSFGTAPYQAGGRLNGSDLLVDGAEFTLVGVQTPTVSANSIGFGELWP
jgi:large repetitive protein